jgi:hypothetical protein
VYAAAGTNGLFILQALTLTPQAYLPFANIGRLDAQ